MTLKDCYIISSCLKITEFVFYLTEITMIILFLFFVLPAFGLTSPPLQIPYGGAGAASLKDDFSFQINPALLGFQTKPELLVSYSLDGKDQRGLLAMQDKKVAFPWTFL